MPHKKNQRILTIFSYNILKYVNRPIMDRPKNTNDTNAPKSVVKSRF